MNCQDIEILIQKAIDNNLSEAGQEILRTHLSGCPDCAKLYQEYVELDQTLKQTLPDVTVPNDLTELVMASVNGLKVVPLRTPAKKKKIWRRASLIVAAAALFLVIGLAALFDSPNSPVAPNLPIADITPNDKDNDNVKIPSTEPDDPNPQDTEPNDDLVDPEPGDNNPASGNEPTQPNDKTIPPANHIETPKTYGGGISLPQVAYGGASHGSYSLYTLASHEEFDAILPRIKDDIVTYYLNADGYYLEWQTDINRGSEPVFVGETESLPSEKAIAGFSDLSSQYDYNYVTAISADGMRQAINRGGDESGLWLLDLTNASAEPVLVDSNNGGGKIISWAPDGNKVLYTSSTGYLYVYYPNEKLVLDIYAGETACVCWAGDSKNIVFSARDNNTGRLSIFSVIVP